jgi:hypothetical protein
MSKRRVKVKRRKQKRPIENKAQAARFARMARELGTEPGGGAFERVLEIFTPKKPRG